VRLLTNIFTFTGGLLNLNIRQTFIELVVLQSRRKSANIKF